MSSPTLVSSAVSTSVGVSGCCGSAEVLSFGSVLGSFFVSGAGAGASFSLIVRLLLAVGPPTVLPSQSTMSLPVMLNFALPTAVAVKVNVMLKVVLLVELVSSTSVPLPPATFASPSPLAPEYLRSEES